MHDKCGFNLKCLLYARHFLNMAMMRLHVIAIHAFLKIYLNINIWDFEAKNETILEGFINMNDNTYEPVHEIYNNVVCATSKTSNHLRIRAV